jgi:ATP-dependent Clp protease ATP-binding subunit ClpC
VVTLARQEARDLGHPRIGTEHLLLGLLSHGEGVGAVALDRLGIDADGVRRRIEEIVGTGPGSVARLTLSPRAKEVFAEAVREAHEMDRHRVGTGHILLGIVDEGAGLAARILVDLGAELPRVRETVLELLRASPGSSGSERPASD